MDRPPDPASVRRYDGLILGFDVGGTKTAVVVGTSEGVIVDRGAVAMVPGASFDASWESIAAIADRLIAAHGSPGAIGISVGGPVDTRRGIVMSPPNLPTWDDVPLRDVCAARYRVPTFLEHDARAGAVAEWLFGAGRGVSSLVFLTFATGLGAGVILDGRVLRGAHDAAGEVGHWRMTRRGPRGYGKVGSWEALSSGSGLPKLAQYRHPTRTWPPELSAKVVVDLARGGDPDALDTIEAASRWLGRGIALLIDLLDPEMVILGSLAVRAGDLFLPTVIATVDRETAERTRACRIVPAGLGESIGDVAAISVAIHPPADAAP